LVLHLQLAGHLIDRAAFAHTLGLVGQEQTMQWRQLRSITSGCSRR
jgi:hypothetical protein